MGERTKIVDGVKVARVYKLDDRKGLRPVAGGPVYVGIDSHKKSLHLTVLDSDGQIVALQTVPNKREHVEALVRRFEGHHVLAVYEAGPTGFALLGWLRDLGCEAFVTPPSMVPTPRGDRVKTDRKDSLKLALWLRANALGSVYELTDEERAAREIGRTYHQTHEHQQDLVRQIKSKCLFHGVVAPWDEADFTVHGLRKSDVEWLLGSPTSRPELDRALAALTRLYLAAKKETDALEKEMEALSKTERYAERARLLLDIDGVGVVTAMTWLLEIPRASEFESAESLAAWIGLVPSEHSTGDAGDGDKKKRGRITRSGNRFVRTALVLVSWGMLKHDASLKRQYDGLRQRGVLSQKAIVAVAHKIARRFYAMMRDMTPYRIAEPPEQAIA